MSIPACLVCNQRINGTAATHRRNLAFSFSLCTCFEDVDARYVREGSGIDSALRLDSLPANISDSEVLDLGSRIFESSKMNLYSCLHSSRRTIPLNKSFSFSPPNTFSTNHRPNIY